MLGTDNNNFRIYQTDPTFPMAEYEMNIKITYNSITRTYPFNITIIASTEPTFNSQETQVNIYANNPMNVTFPSATDTEGDQIYYFLDVTSTAAPFTFASVDTVSYSVPTFLFQDVLPAYVGQYNFTISACSNIDISFCSEYTFNISVSSVPVLNITIDSEEVATYTVSQTITRDTPCYVDAEGDAITYNYDMGGLSGATIQCEPTFQMTLPTFAPGDIGTYTITLNASETTSSDDSNSTHSFDLEVVANEPPNVENSVSGMVMYAFMTGTDAEFAITSPIFNDTHDTTVTVHLTASPTTSIFSYDQATSVLTVGATTNADSGAYTLTFTGDDGIASSANATTTATFTINDNLPPLTVATPPTEMGPYYGARSHTVDLSVYFVADVQGEPISYNLATPANGTFLTFDTATGIMTIPDDNDKEGNYSLTVSTRDSNYPTNGQTDLTFTLEILNNQGPTTTETLADLEVVALYAMLVDWDDSFFTDREGDTIDWEILDDFTDNSWATYTDADVSFGGYPPVSETGVHEVKLRLFDDKGDETFYPIVVNITTNHLPEANSSTSFSVSMQCLHPFSIDLQDFFFDQNTGEVMRYQIVSGAFSALSVSNTTHLMTGTETCNSNATEDHLIRVYDTKDQYAEFNISITSIIDEPPVLNDTLAFTK